MRRGAGLPWSAPVLAGVGLLVACSGGSGAQIDAPEYTSVEMLAESADHVVVGEFTARTGSGHEADLYDGDNGGFIGDDRGLPMDFWQFRVAETLAGATGLDGRDVTITQLTGSSDYGCYTAAPGRDSVLFLRTYTDRDGAYGLVGLGDGSLAVTDQGLVAPDCADPALADDAVAIGGLDGLSTLLEGVEVGSAR